MSIVNPPVKVAISQRLPRRAGEHHPIRGMLGARFTCPGRSANVAVRPMEAHMSSVDVSSGSAAGSPPVKAGEMRLEVVVVPVSDVDRAKRFYESLDWRLDADFTVDDGYRVVQLTPPGSGCSII